MKKAMFSLLSAAVLAGGFGALVAHATTQPTHKVPTIDPLKTTRVEEKAPTTADMHQATHVVEETIKARGKQDPRKVESLVYNTLPVPYPDNWFEKQSSKWSVPSYEIGIPYVLQNWTTAPDMITHDRSAKDETIHQYNTVFSHAITVPVTIGEESTPTLFHCVRDSAGKWKVAYNFLHGFEIFDHPEDIQTFINNN